jgi:hypothetical protein
VRIGLAADSHGDWRALDAWAARHRLDLVVHCGDAHGTDTDGVPVLSARGNHEQRVERAARPAFVPDYGVREIGGLRWVFLGCNSVGGGVAAPPTELPEADVLVSHEAPFNPRMGWEGHPVVRRVVERLTPRWCFSGHWHHKAKGWVGRTECFALGHEPHGWLVAEVADGELELSV